MNLLLAQDPNQTYLLWGFLLVAVVVILVLLELFIPSGGLIAALAGVAAVGSIVAFFMHDASTGLLAALVYLVAGPIAVWGLFKLWMNSPLASKMVLGGIERLDDEGPDGLAAAEKARRDRLAQLRELIGAEGVTATPLRPVGVVKINGERVDALAESGIIDAGTTVVVTDVYDNQIKVRPR